MSRARELDVDGPGLLRTRRWPWGIPDIGGTARSALEIDNDWIRLALSAIREVSSRASHPTIMWVAPEDRGGDAASVWQLPELRKFSSSGGWFRYGFHQCELVSALRPRPTGVLTLSPLRHTSLAKGWPKFASAQTSYIGPLGPLCSCGNTHEPWSKRARNRPRAILEPGVTTKLMSIACESGLARHLRMGRRRARKTASAERKPSSSSNRRSPSPAPSTASSAGSTTTCVSAPSTVTGDEAIQAQWDDEAAAALGIQMKNQDRLTTPSKNPLAAVSREEHAIWKPCGGGDNLDILWHDGTAVYALPSGEGMPMLMRCSGSSMPLCAAFRGRYAYAYALLGIEYALMRCLQPKVRPFMRCPSMMEYASMRCLSF